MVDELVVELAEAELVVKCVVDEAVLEVLELLVGVGVDVVELVVVDEGVLEVLEVLELVVVVGVEVVELVVVAGVDADDCVVVPVAVVTASEFDVVSVFPHPTASR